MGGGVGKNRIIDLIIMEISETKVIQDSFFSSIFAKRTIVYG